MSVCIVALALQVRESRLERGENKVARDIQFQTWRARWRDSLLITRRKEAVGSIVQGEEETSPPDHSGPF